MVPQLPSISPCSHLLPVTGTQEVIHDELPRTPIASCSRLLYLVRLQFICITGKPLNQVMRHHVAWAAGERWVSWTSILELLPLSNAIHCPALPKTGSGQWRHHHHHILSAPQLHPSSFCQSLPASFIWRSPELTLSCKQKWTIIQSQTYVLDTRLDLLPPPEIAALETLLVNLHQYRVNIDVTIIIRLQQQIKVGVSHRPAKEGICKLN